MYLVLTYPVTVTPRVDRNSNDESKELSIVQSFQYNCFLLSELKRAICLLFPVSFRLFLLAIFSSSYSSLSSDKGMLPQPRLCMQTRVFAMSRIYRNFCGKVCKKCTWSQATRTWELRLLAMFKRTSIITQSSRTDHKICSCDWQMVDVTILRVSHSNNVLPVWAIPSAIHMSDLDCIFFYSNQCYYLHKPRLQVWVPVLVTPIDDGTRACLRILHTVLSGKINDDSRITLLLNLLRLSFFHSCCLLCLALVLQHGDVLWTTAFALVAINCVSMLCLQVWDEIWVSVE